MPTILQRSIWIPFATTDQPAVSHGARDETGLRRHPVPVSCICVALIIPMPCQRYNIFIFTRVILLSLSPVTPTLPPTPYTHSSSTAGADAAPEAE